MPRTSKSRNPFGNILKVKTKKLGYAVTVYDARKRYAALDGTKQQKFKRCATYEEALAALQNFHNEIKNELAGALEEKNNPTPKTFLDLTNYFRSEYLIKAKIVDDRIVEGYRQDIKRLSAQITDFEIFFGNLPLPDLNYEQIRKYKIQLSTSPQKHKFVDKPPKQATVNRKLAMLRRILNVGVQLGWLPFNPFTAGKPLVESRAENHRTRILTFEEERILLEACEHDVKIETIRKGKKFEMNYVAPYRILRTVLILALDTGMRKGEIFAVRRNQMDFDKMTISLEAAQTKSFKARTIPVSERLAGELQAHFGKYNITETDQIFGGVKNMRKSFASVLEIAKLEDVVFHDLRHTAISWMDLAGVTEMVKKNIVGHSSGDVHQLYHNQSVNVLEDARGKINEFRRKIDKSLERKENSQAA